MPTDFDIPAWMHRLHNPGDGISREQVWEELRHALRGVEIDDIKAREALMLDLEREAGTGSPPSPARQHLEQLWQDKGWRWTRRCTDADTPAWHREIVNAVNAKLPGVVSTLLEGASVTTVQAFLDSPVSFAGPPVIRPIPPQRPPTHGQHLRSPWAELVEHHSPEMIQVFLAHGADPQGEHIQGSPLLAHASTPEMVDLLLASGTDPLNPALPFVQRERSLQELWYAWTYQKIPNTLAYMRQRLKDWPTYERDQALGPLYWIVRSAWSDLSSWEQERCTARHDVLQQAWASLSQGRPPAPPTIAGERVPPSAFASYLRWRQSKDGRTRWRRGRVRITPGLAWEWLEQVAHRNPRASYPWAHHDAESAVQAWAPALVEMLGREGAWRKAWDVAAPLLSGPLRHHRLLDILKPAQEHVLATNSHHQMFDTACTMWAMNRQHIRESRPFLSHATMQAWLNDAAWDENPRALHWAAVILLHAQTSREPCSQGLLEQASQRYIKLCARHEEAGRWHGPDPDEVLHTALRIAPANQDFPRRILTERLRQGIGNTGEVQRSRPRV